MIAVISLQNQELNINLTRGCINTARLVLKKTLFFCMGKYAEYVFDQQRFLWYVFRLWDMVFS